MLFSSRISVKVGIRFSVWLVSGYAHVFVLLCVVIVPYAHGNFQITTFTDCISQLLFCSVDIAPRLKSRANRIEIKMK